ncbi:MAG: hypothetical protein J0H46_05355 [Bacteroidetes bacterium]|nr:hypothetical protein [Bacteroidota bacterium]
MKNLILVFCLAAATMVSCGPPRHLPPGPPPPPPGAPVPPAPPTPPPPPGR